MGPWRSELQRSIAGVYVLGRRAETEESTAGHVFGRRRFANPLQTINVNVNGRSLPFTIETDGVNWTAFTKIGRKKIVSDRFEQVGGAAVGHRAGQQHVGQR